MTEADHIKAIHLFAEGNPHPLVASFRFTPLAGRAAFPAAVWGHLRSSNAGVFDAASAGFPPPDAMSALLSSLEVRGEFNQTNSLLKSLILAQNERWRRGLGMQVERERGNPSKAA